MTRILDLAEIGSYVSGLVHLKTQKTTAGLDFTVGAIHRVTGPGSLDFGGSELEAASREEVSPRLRSEDDDYGWWDLDPGSYVVRYNESLTVRVEGTIAQVMPLERLLLAGASHPTFLVDGTRDPLETLLHVGSGGCRLKENCRISRVLLMET